MKSLKVFVFSAVFVLIGCASQKQIYTDRLINHSNRHLYVNDSLDFSMSYFDVIVLKSIQTDSLDFKKTTVPPEFQKHLKTSVKSPSEILFTAHRASMSNEDIIAVLYDKQGDSFTFSKEMVKKLLKIVPKDSIDFQPMQTSAGYFLNNKNFQGDQVRGSYFMRKRSFNELRYNLHNAKSDYKIHEFHVDFDARHTLRLIWIADIRKTVAAAGWEKIDEQDHHLELFSLSDSAKFRLQEVVPENLHFLTVNEFRKTGYMGVVSMLKGYENVIEKKGTLEQKDEFYQEMMTFQSFMGNHKAALAYDDKTPQPKTDKLADDYFDKSEAHDAADYILQKAENQQVIMFNEAHSCGQSRAFMRDILRGLYDKGFRHLALETLADQDSILLRGYPLRHLSGYYSDEPTYGQMLREAIAVGFHLWDYENHLPCRNGDCINFREEQQARNLKKILDKDPKAKILVWAGHGHIREKDDITRQMMAFRFKKMTGIDPLTVENTLLRESSAEATDPSVWKMALEKWQFKKPIIVTVKDTAFVLPSRVGAVDMHIFYPRTTYTNDYPDWMGNSATDFYDLTLEKDYFKDKLLMIFLLKEYSKEIEGAIPVMNIPLSRIGNFRLFLKPDSYVAVVRDAVNFEYFYKEFDIKKAK